MYIKKIERERKYKKYGFQLIMSIFIIAFSITICESFTMVLVLKGNKLGIIWLFYLTSLIGALFIIPLNILAIKVKSYSRIKSIIILSLGDGLYIGSVIGFSCYLLKFYGS